MIPTASGQADAGSLYQADPTEQLRTHGRERTQSRYDRFVGKRRQYIPRVKICMWVLFLSSARDSDDARALRASAEACLRSHVRLEHVLGCLKACAYACITPHEPGELVADAR